MKYIDKIERTKQLNRPMGSVGLVAPTPDDAPSGGFEIETWPGDPAEGLTEGLNNYAEGVVEGTNDAAKAFGEALTPMMEDAEDRLENPRKGIAGIWDRVVGGAETLAGAAAAGAGIYGALGGLAVGPGVAHATNALARGIGYIGTRLLSGFIDSADNIWDYTMGGIYTLLGREEKAKELFDNSPADAIRKEGDTLYKDGEIPNFMKRAGNFAETVGASLPSIGTAFLSTVAAPYMGATAFGSAALGTMLSSSMIGLGTAGRSTRTAYKQTGELGGKEFAYGALKGGADAAANFATNHFVRGKLADKIEKSWIKASEEFVSYSVITPMRALTNVMVTAMGQRAAPALVNIFSEGLEGGLEAWLDPFFKRWTYDESAENATKGEIAWAAITAGFTSIVVSHIGNKYVGMSDIDVRRARDYDPIESTFGSGTKEAEDPIDDEKASDIMNEAAKTEEGEYPITQKVREEHTKLSASLKKTGGKVATDEQRRALAELRKNTAAARVIPIIETSALNVVERAEMFAEKYNQLGMKGPDGEPIEITADDLVEGIDFEGTEEEVLASLQKALANNEKLAVVASSQVANGIASLQQEQDLLSTYAGGASAEQRGELSGILGADLENYTDAKKGARRFAETAQGKDLLRTAQDIEQKAKSVPPNDNPPPTVIGTALPDGVYRYGGDDGICIIKENGVIRVYDYARGLISKPLTTMQVNAALARARNQKA